MVDMAHFAGLVAAGAYPSPIPHADVVTTTTHKTLRGPRGGLILCKAEHAKAIDKSVFPGSQGGPLEHVIAAKAVCFKEALDPSFKSVRAAASSPTRARSPRRSSSRGFQIVSGGTDNHLMLVDLRNRGLTGKVAQIALDEAAITVNKNTVPKETQSPFVTSGIRIGTSAVTTRGMGERGDGAHRRADRSRARGAGRQEGRGCGEGRRSCVDEGVSAVRVDGRRPRLPNSETPKAETTERRDYRTPRLPNSETAKLRDGQTPRPPDSETAKLRN